MSGTTGEQLSRVMFPTTKERKKDNIRQNEKLENAIKKLLDTTQKTVDDKSTEQSENKKIKVVF